MSATIFQLLLRGFAHLPFRWIQNIGAAIGWLGAHVPNEQRAVTRRNLDLCFPELSSRERLALARQSLVETGKTLTETIALWLGPQARVAKLIGEVRGEEALRAAVEEGRGVILCSPHLGSWEMAGLYFGTHYPMTSLYRPPRQQRFETIVREARQRTGARLVPTNAGGIRTLFQVLKQAQVIGILPDQDPRDEGGEFAPFFGIQANTMTLVSRLAGKTGAAVFLTFAERLPKGGGFRLHILPAPSEVADADPSRAAAALNAGVERCVRMAPTQYQWSYKRFRTRPTGDPRRY